MWICVMLGAKMFLMIFLKKIGDFHRNLWIFPNFENFHDFSNIYDFL